MADPATGTAAASAAIATSTGTMLGLSFVMPADASFYEFVWGCAFAMLGAFCFQFIRAQDARQKAADQGVPIENRPKIDTVMLGYSMCGAPMAAACLIYIIHKAGGATGFGDGTWLLSVVGYMIAGAAGPPLVLKVVGYVTGLLSSKIGGAP